MPKKTRVNKSREQILSDLKKNAEFKKKIKFVKELFFPALLRASKNVDDAQMTLTGFNSAVMQAFLAKMKEVKVKDLNLEPQLSLENDKLEESKEMLHLFDELSVFEAKDYIEGMKNEIALNQSEFWKTKTLSDLPMRWLDELE